MLPTVAPFITKTHIPVNSTYNKMREVEKTITYELTPEEREDCTLENEMLNQARNGWDAVKIPRKTQMEFDANYNTYYAKVTYDRAS